MNKKNITTKAKLVALLASCMVGSNYASAAINIADSNGWKLDFTGAVNAYLLYNAPKDTAKEKTMRIRTGFNPSQVGFNAMAPNWGDQKVKARIAFYPSIQNDNSKAGEPALQLRESFMSISGDGGEWVMGRTLSLYQRQQVIFDQSGLGVGSTDEYSSGNSTTAGMIGYGYLYTNFNAGITYTTPNMAGLMLSVGIYDPADIGYDTGGSTTIAQAVKTPRLEYELNYDLAFNEMTKLKVFVSGLSQSATLLTAYGSKAVGDKLTASGFSGGAIFKWDRTTVGASVYSGKALGLGGNISGANTVRSDGTENDASGNFVQVIQGFGSFDLGVASGSSEVKNSATTKLVNTGTQVLFIYHATDYLKFNVEAGSFKDKSGTTVSAEYSSYNVGATLRF